MAPMRKRAGAWAEGSLELIPGQEVLRIASERALDARIVFVSASTPRTAVAVHMRGGIPIYAASSGQHLASSKREEAYLARQALIDALTWPKGWFMLEQGSGALPPGVEPQDLGSAMELLEEARARAALWPELVRRLPTIWDETVVHPVKLEPLPADPVEQAVLQILDSPQPLPSIGPRCGKDHHRVLQAVISLAQAGHVRLAPSEKFASVGSPRARKLVRLLSSVLAPAGTGSGVFKITILSWDSKTCYRMVEALTGSFARLPLDVETHPKYQILHKTAALGEGLILEVLAFRSDVFVPTLAAPLVKNCHVFLLVVDLDAGHVWGAEKPLVERIQEIREMFSEAAVAARITVGAGAVTDPGCDMLIPELCRFVSWDDLSKPDVLERILGEIAARLGLPEV